MKAIKLGWLVDREAVAMIHILHWEPDEDGDHPGSVLSRSDFGARCAGARARAAPTAAVGGEAAFLIPRKHRYILGCGRHQCCLFAHKTWCSLQSGTCFYRMKQSRPNLGGGLIAGALPKTKAAEGNRVCLTISISGRH